MSPSDTVDVRMTNVHDNEMKDPEPGVVWVSPQPNPHVRKALEQCEGRRLKKAEDRSEARMFNGKASFSMVVSVVSNYPQPK